MEDKNIVELFFLRDENAVKQCQSKYGAYCGTIAYNILANNQDSEECVNDTWMKAWDSIPPEEPRSLRVYLGCIVRNLAINLYHHKRAGKRYHEMDMLLSELEECIPDQCTVDGEMDATFLGEVINKWLYSLDVEARRLFVRRYWYSIPVKKLAKMSGCTANAISSKLKRLRQELRQQLEKEGIIL